MLNKAPVVFFDNRPKLDSNFLKILANAEIENEIIILTSDKSTQIPKSKSKIEKVDIQSLSNYAECERQFLSRYIHLSTNSYDFETACFLRFFAVECLVKERNFQWFWLLDCDVWPTKSISIFSKAEESFFSPDYFDFTTISSHSSLMSNALLIEFNEFILNIFYSELIGDLEKRYCISSKEGIKGGISDMTAMGVFLREYSISSWHDSNVFGVNGHFLSHTVSRLHLDFGKSEKNYMLVIRTKNCFIVICGNMIRKYSTLHFQGNHKFLIPIFQKFRIVWGNQNTFSLLVRISRKYQKLFI